MIRHCEHISIKLAITICVHTAFLAWEVLAISKGCWAFAWSLTTQMSLLERAALQLLHFIVEDLLLGIDFPAIYLALLLLLSRVLDCLGVEWGLRLRGDQLEGL